MTTAVDLLSTDYSLRMKQALNLAARGRGFTQPNPMVGAMVLDAAGVPVAEAFHAKAGEPHAERLALETAGTKARGGTLIVTLEPCCHQGRTPPCTEAILAAGLERVVACHEDPDVRVSGKGFETLRKAGLQVVVGVEEQAAERLNRYYLHHRRTGRPWVTLKWAMSMDGHIADRAGNSRWISSAACRQHAHALRSLHDAILVGAETARRDDPQLSLHDVAGLPPHRYVLVGRRDVPSNLRLFTEGTPAVKVGTQEGADWVVGTDSRGWPDVLEVVSRLGSEGHLALLVEGGGRVSQSFLEAGVVQQIVVYYAPKLLGQGRSATGELTLPLEAALTLVDVTTETLDGGWVVSGLVGRT